MKKNLGLIRILCIVFSLVLLFTAAAEPSYASAKEKTPSVKFTSSVEKKMPSVKFTSSVEKKTPSVKFTSSVEKKTPSVKFTSSVEKKMPSVKFTSITEKIYVWDTFTFEAEGMNFTETPKIRYSVSDKGIASIIAKTGTFTPKKTGTVTVTATEKKSGISASVKVKVVTGPTKPLKTIKPNKYVKDNGIYVLRQENTGKTPAEDPGETSEETTAEETGETSEETTAEETGETSGEITAEEAGETSEEITTEDPVTKETEEKKNILEARISLTGDIMCLAGQQFPARSNGVYNFNGSFKYLKELFSRTDFAFGNLETQISYSLPITSVSKTVDGMPHCNAPGTFLDAVRYAGFNAVATANNHCLDGGLNALLETDEVLERYDIPNVGTYSSKNEDRYILVDINGIKVAFLSYTELINRRSDVSSDKRDIYIGQYSKKAVEDDIALVRGLGADFVIVYNHWGSENTTTLTSAQKAHAKEIANAGADLIIGSHSHCLQPCEYIKTDDGRKVLCMYSMGNLVSSMARDINNDAIVLEITVQKNVKSGKVKMSSVGYIPAWVYASKDGKHHVITPTNKDFNGGIKNQTLTASAKRIKDVLGGVIKEITAE